MINSPRIIINIEFWSLKVELEWLLMKSCKKPPFPILLAEVLIFKSLFFSKTSKNGSNAYYQWCMISYSSLPITRKFWSLEFLLECLLMKFCEKTLPSFISRDINLAKFILSKTSKHGSNAYYQLSMISSSRILGPRKL